MKFGKQFRAIQLSQWAEQYLDYKGLKQLIGYLWVDGDKPAKQPSPIILSTRRDSSSTSLPGPVDGTNPSHDHNTRDLIDKKNPETISRDAPQDEKVKAFFTAFKRSINGVDNHLKSIIRRISQTVKEIEESCAHMKGEAAVQKRTTVTKLHRTVTNALLFLSSNETAAKKILKKFVKKSGEPASRIEKQDSNVEKRMRLREAALDDATKRIEHVLTDILPPPEQEQTDQKDLEEYVWEDPIATVSELDLGALPAGEVTKLRLAISTNAMGEKITIPLIIAKGAHQGPILGITAALHGNELNGMPVIFRLFKELDAEELFGTIVACPVANPPGYLRNQRGFSDNQDLNRLFPGKINGNCGQVYVHFLLEKLVSKLEYLCDLHTASFGRVNSLYVRADMNDNVTKQMALLQNPQIIVHNTAPDGSLRAAAMNLGIKTITVEIGNPSVFHETFIRNALRGIENILSYLKMDFSSEIELNAQPQLCARSFWLYATHGGILTINRQVNTWITKGTVFATVRTIFGEIVARYKAPEDGIIVGKNVNPSCNVGDRLIHLGVCSTEFAKKADDGHT